MNSVAPKTRSVVLTAAVASGAGAWAASAIASLAYVSVTSRVFTPATIGSYSSAMLAEGLLYLVLGSGLSIGIQRRSGIPDDDEHAYYGRAIVVGLLAGVAMLLLAGPWASLWGNPNAEQFVRIWAMVALLHPLSLVLLGVLRKRDEHSRAAKAMLISGVGCSLLGVIPVLVTRDPLSLVASNILFPALLIGSCVAYGVRGRPSLSSRIKESQFVRSSTRLNVTNYIAYNAIAWSVSRFISSAGLGVFSRAWLMADLPAQGLASAASSALFPSWGSDDSDSKRAALTDALVVVPAAVALILAVISALATPIVAIFLGAQWTEAIALLAILPIFLAALAPQWLLASRLQAMGKFRVLAVSRIVALVTAAVFVVLVATTGDIVIAAVGAGFVYLTAHIADLKSASALAALAPKPILRAYLQLLTACALLWATGIAQAADIWRPSGAAEMIALGGAAAIGLIAGLLITSRGRAGRVLESRGVIPQWVPQLFRPGLGDPV